MSTTVEIMRRTIATAALVASGLSLAAATAIAASFAAPVSRCAPDAVVAGTVCLDKYEASVRRVPNPTTTNAGLVRRIQLGRATLADLTAGGATQLGVIATDDYAPCADSGPGHPTPARTTERKTATREARWPSPRDRAAPACRRPGPSTWSATSPSTWPIGAAIDHVRPLDARHQCDGLQLPVGCSRER